MMDRRTFICGVMAAAVAPFAFATRAKAAIADLFAGARARRAAIASLDVVHLDSHSETPVAIAPSALEGFKNAYRSHTTDQKTIGAALAVVERSSPVPNEHTPELRWKMTFRDASKKPVLEVWHHSYEAYGMIGSTRVKFANDEILKFLHANFDKNA
jgi:hypothetical protein